MGSGNNLYEFGPFSLNAGERVLLREGRVVPIAPKALSTLLVLVKNKGHLVEKNALMDEVWPEEVVEEGNLAQHIFILRKVLGETDGQIYIETIPRRGYRFVAPVNKSLEGNAQPAGIGSERSTARKDSQDLVTGLQSIAVLPFETLGAATQDEFLGLGIADALVTKLSNLKRVTVRPTSASRSAIRTDPVSAGGQLKVATVLEGTIQKWDENIRVTVQLVSVRDGATLWAERFDEKFTSIFAIEDSISEQVATALAVKLTAEEQMQLARRYTENTQAHHAYLKGRFFFEKRSKESIAKGIEYFELAIRIDPQYALAYAGLADSYSTMGSVDFVPSSESIPKARQAALQALNIEPNLADGHAALAQTQMHEWNWQAAETSFKLAIDLSPNHATAHRFYALYLRNTGRFEESLAVSMKAEELDPTSAFLKSTNGGTLYCARRYEEAFDELREALELDSNNAVAHYYLARVYVQKAMYEEAIQEYQRIISLIGERPELYAHLGYIYGLLGNRDAARQLLAKLESLANSSHVPSYFKVLVYLGLNEKTPALECLERAYREHDINLLFLGVDPMLDSLRAEPRFISLLRRTGLLTRVPGIGRELNGKSSRGTNAVAPECDLERKVPPTQTDEGLTVSSSYSTSLKRTFEADTKNREAHRAYINGRYRWSKHTKEGLQAAIGCFQQAIKLDPNYVLAYTALVDSYLRLATNYVPPSDALPERPETSQPLRPDELFPETRPSVAIRCDWDRKALERGLGRAGGYTSGAPAVRQWHAAYLFSRDLYQQAQGDVRVGAMNDPFELRYSPLTLDEEVQIFCVVAIDQMIAGNYEAACAVLKRWWTFGEWPRLEGLSSRASADLLMTTGAIAGCEAGARQLPRGQKHAEALLNGAIALAEQLGYPTVSAEGRFELALCYFREGMFDLARTTLEGVPDAFSAYDLELKSFSLVLLALIERHAGRLNEGLARLNQAAENEKMFGPCAAAFYHQELASTLSDLATTKTQTEYGDQALNHYQQALDLFELVGNYRHAAVVEKDRGSLLLTLGRLTEAEARVGRARRLYDALGDSIRRAHADTTVAQIQAAAGRLDLAEQAVSHAVKTLETSEQEAFLAEALTTQGLVFCKLGRHRAAKRILDRAHGVAERCGDRQGAGRALLTEIEEMCDQLEDDERLELGTRLDHLLAHTVEARTINKLRKGRETIGAR